MSVYFKEESWISRELQIEVNSDGIIKRATSNCYNITGYTDTEILNSNINQYINFNITDFYYDKNFQAEFLKKDGTKTYFDISTFPIINDNKIVSIKLSCFDISKYLDMPNKYNSLVKMLEKSKDIIYKLDLYPEPKFTYLSPSVADLFGRSIDEFYLNPMLAFELVHEDDYEIQLSKMSKNTDFSKTLCVRFMHSDGSYFWLEDYIIPTYDSKGELISIEGIARNIQERKELEEKLERLSYHDALTGLHNRTYLNSKIQVLTKTLDVSVATIVCDLDNLKDINDNFGHLEGDKQLRRVAKFFNSFFDKKDSIITRNGGDEFIIILTNISLKKAEDIYLNMLLSIEKYNETSEMPIELSSGFAYSSTSKTLIEQINKADGNMYKNKYKKRKQLNYYK